MNNSRRKRIDALIERIDDLMSDLDLIREEEQDAYDNMPESFQDSERGEAMYNAIDNLETAASYLEDIRSSKKKEEEIEKEKEKEKESNQ